MDCLIVGGGALGGYFGWRLAKGGASVDMVCRSNFLTVARDGFVISTEEGEAHFMPRRIMHASEALSDLGCYDVVILAMKVTDETSLVAAVDRFARYARAVCLLRNGVDVEKHASSAYPDIEILDIVPYAAVTRTSPNSIKRSVPALFAIGSSKRDGVLVAGLASTLQAGGTRAALVDDVRDARWKKAVWNVAFNSVSSLLGGAGTQDILADPAARQLILQLMAEVCRVASADGYPLPKDFAAFNLQSTSRMPNYVPSTAQDVVAGNAFELDAMFTNVLRVAERHSVETPVLATVTQLLQAMSRIPSMTRDSRRTR